MPMNNDSNNPQWPFELFDIECEDGWKKLYEPIIEYIQEYNKTHEDNPIEIHQIKEKYGSLRFYTNYYTEDLRKMIDNAEHESYYTCEICGKYIDQPIVKNHWIYPFCKECFDNIHKKAST